MPEACDTAAAEALAALAERYAALLRHEFPLAAFLAGQAGDDPTMFREAPADFERRAGRAAAMLGELATIPAQGLPAQDRITHRLLQRELDDLVQVHATRSHWRPWLLPGGPEFNTIFFANASHASDAVAARRHADRLETLPGYFADVMACLREGAAHGVRLPRVVLQAALGNLRAAATGPLEQMPWLGPYRRSPAAAQPAVQREAARAHRIVEGAILPALHALADALEHELLPAARDSLACTEGPQGEAFYAFWVRHFTTLPLTPAAIHAMGLEHVARLEGEIAAVAAEAGFGSDVARYRRFLRDEPSFYAPGAAALLEQAQALAKRIDGHVPALVGHLPRATYTVRPIPPAAAEKLPLAYAQPNPADGSAPAVFWISSLVERVPLYLLPSLSLHEAWPGHLMHIALMQEMDALPAFRRANFTKYTACLEGWAMYCEFLGEELGLYETPHQRFGRLDMEMWRACRLVVDTGLHTRSWTRGQACVYMAERLSLPRAAIEAEVDRYVAMPGQALGYLPGGLKFRELRRRAQVRLGERFSLRAFHDRLMAAGAVTLPVLEEVIDDWLVQHAA